MGKRRRRDVLPVMLLWSKGAQKRFSESVEALQSLVQRAEALLPRLEAAAAVIDAGRAKRSQAAQKANKTRQALHNGPAAPETNPLGLDPKQ